MTGQRKPGAFRLDPEPAMDEAETARQHGSTTNSQRRRPRAVRDEAVVEPAAVDIFAEPDEALSEPPPALPPKRRSRLGAVFLGAAGLLVSIALGLWIDRLVRDLFARADWLGWTAAAVAAVAALSLLLILVREMLALSRLRSVEKLRQRGLDALARDDAKAARALADDLAAFVAAKPETAAGRRTLADQRGEIIDGADLVRLAEAQLLTPLDEKARTMVLDAAKRVSLVTAVSPRALVDVAYVVFESARLIRRLSELYGGRPGLLGFVRLARGVLAHLAVTGSIAAGDSFVHQIVGHGLAARLSAKLGEGVVNGMMTARISIAAMETARPLAFNAVRRPRMGDFLATLASFAGQKGTVAGSGKT